MKSLSKAFFGYLLVSAVLFLGFVSLYKNEADILKEAEGSVQVGTETITNTFVLNGETDAPAFSDYLYRRGIYPDRVDADCISNWIVPRIGRHGLQNLGELNKNHFRMPADWADSLGGNALRQTVSASRFTLGVTPDVERIYRDAPMGDGGQVVLFNVDSLSRLVSATLPQPEDPAHISVRVLKTKDNIAALTVDSTGLRKVARIPLVGRTIADKLLSARKQAAANKEGVPGVFVRLIDYTADPEGDLLGYARTDSEGTVTFTLPAGGYYSVLPVRKGYEYGSSKGTRKGPLGKDDLSFSFTQKVHTIRPVQSRVYSRIKEDNLVSVRSVRQFKDSLLFYPLLFFAAWLLYFIGSAIVDKTKKRNRDHIIPLALMTLSGIGLLAMFSIVNPLTDTLLGSTMTWGCCVGVLGLFLLSLVDWGKFFSIGLNFAGGILEFDFILQFFRWLAMPFKEKVSRMKIDRGAKHSSWHVAVYYVNLLVSFILIPVELLLRGCGWLFNACNRLFKRAVGGVVSKPGPRLREWLSSSSEMRLPKGFGYLLLVLFFIVLLFFFGDGPEGSGTKVNLLFFQPSELNKYLVVFFMAAFFAVRSDRIRAFSDKVSSVNLGIQVRSVALIVISIAVLLLLYMVVMSDMGPALVLIVTFILLYSLARRDFLQLLLGVTSFLLMVYLAGIVNPGSLRTRILFAVIWFVGWVVIGYVKDKRIYESAIFFNVLLSAFLFVGDLMVDSKIERIQSVGQRIVDRNQVAMHLWDNSVQGGGDQVVQGIWSLATGGFSGQGLGQANPNLVPAFHTDMIFTSIGEEMGWAALALVILCLFVLFHRSLIIAYRSGNRFLFFLTSGIAIVTAVQFFVIIFGSLGIIPLTGVAVPFLSFGMTSMIINLAIFGVVIAVSGVRPTVNQRDVNKPYMNVSAVGIETFFVVSVFLVAVLFRYQVLPSVRNKTLIRPAYVSNDTGARLAEYNPRIAMLIKNLKAGNIYDRNGLLLATSDRDLLQANAENIVNSVSGQSVSSGWMQNRIDEELQSAKRRYYPFADHMFFMLGDINTMTLWGTDSDNPYGYLAEERLLDDLRGFTTASTTNDGTIIKDVLPGRYQISPFAPGVDEEFKYVHRDYRQLLPFLKDGIHGKLVEKYNRKTEEGDRDAYLTVDSRLQTVLQSRMQIACPRLNRYKLRASVVVLNAENGDLLSSSNYPLPCQDTIRKYLDLKIDYSKYERTYSNPVYSDRDLGLTYQTAPGSTAKVMSAIAGFMRLGDQAAEELYHISSRETIEPPTSEPNDSDSSPDKQYHYPPSHLKHTRVQAVNCSHSVEESRLINMEKAIVWSSNCFFINLVHHNDLYEQLGSVYSSVGARVASNDTGRPVYCNTYFFEPDEFSLPERESFLNCVHSVGTRGISYYHSDLIRNHNRGLYNSEIMGGGPMQWAWGQGTLDASPLNMARVASIVYNHGSMPRTRYVLAEGGRDHLSYSSSSSVPLISDDQSSLLRQYMQEETTKHRSIKRSNRCTTLPGSMGGKTGTPERDIKYNGRRVTKVNDGWYICFVESTSRQINLETGDTEEVSTPLAIAVRLERVGRGGSGTAVKFLETTVIPALVESGYRME